MSISSSSSRSSSNNSRRSSSSTSLCTIPRLIIVTVMYSRCDFSLFLLI